MRCGGLNRIGVAEGSFSLIVIIVRMLERVKIGARGGILGVAVQMELTVPVNVVCRDFARASQPTMRAISWTRDFVSRALASFDRS